MHGAGTGLLGALLNCLMVRQDTREKQQVLEGGGFLHQQGYEPKRDDLKPNFSSAAAAASAGRTDGLPGRMPGQTTVRNASLSLSDITPDLMRHDYRDKRIDRDWQCLIGH